MITTRNNQLRTPTTEYQPLRHALNVRRLGITEKDRASRLVKDPNTLQMYTLLIEQQGKSVKDYFSENKHNSLNRRYEYDALITELFPRVEDSKKGTDQGIDVIVSHNFFLETTKVNFASQNVSNSNLSEFCDLKNNTEAFDELIKARYQTYKRNFMKVAIDEPSQAEPIHNKMLSRNKTTCFNFVEKSEIRMRKVSMMTDDGEHDSDIQACAVSDRFTRNEINYQSFTGIHPTEARTFKNQKDTQSTCKSSVNSNDQQEHDLEPRERLKSTFSRVLSSKRFV